MAKQGDWDRPNPRHCPSFERDALTGRRSTDSIRARSKQDAASRARIDDSASGKPVLVPTARPAPPDVISEFFDLAARMKALPLAADWAIAVSFCLIDRRSISDFRQLR